jgi:SPP1 family predicted phage head-tail adaptor
MRSIRAGDLDQRITLQQITETRDSFGGVTETWTDVATVWAGISMLSGRESFAAQHVYAEATHRVIVRYRTGVDAKMRVKWGSKYLNIISVDETVRRKGMLVLVCEEVV